MMLGDHRMIMALPASIPTLKSFATGNYTRVDNVFCTQELHDSIICCDTIPGWQPIKTDHFPIITEIDVRPDIADARERRNWKMVDWEDLRKQLKERMVELGEPKEIEN